MIWACMCILKTQGCQKVNTEEIKFKQPDIIPPFTSRSPSLTWGCLETAFIYDHQMAVLSNLSVPSSTFHSVFPRE